jgi:hypothetical protein
MSHLNAGYQTIQTISPNTASHAILKILRDHIVNYNMTAANREDPMCAPCASTKKHGNYSKLETRLNPIQLRRRLIRQLWNMELEGSFHDPKTQGLNRAEKRLLDSGLIHIRWRWYNERTDALLLPDFAITDKGREALSVLHKGGFYVLAWPTMEEN